MERASRLADCRSLTVKPLLTRGSSCALSVLRVLRGEKQSAAQVTVALGFEMKGGWKDLKNTTALSVLVTMLGGGGSFSAGGPGKGMYSRLYQRVLNRHAWISNCQAFQNGYNDTGLVGVLATCPGHQAKQMVDIIVAELQVSSFE
jgi:predicted Zn-dependent peptidase